MLRPIEPIPDQKKQALVNRACFWGKGGLFPRRLVPCPQALGAKISFFGAAIFGQRDLLNIGVPFSFGLVQ